MNITNISVLPFQGDGNLMAFVSCQIESEMGKLYLTGMKIMNSSKGPFLAMPSRKDKNDEYKDIYFFTKNIKANIQAEAMNKLQYNANGNLQNNNGNQGGNNNGGNNGQNYGNNQTQQQTGGGGFGQAQNGGGGGFGGPR